MRFRRDSTDAAASAAVEPDPEPWGKGRATPKRRDRVPARQPMSAPRTNKEAAQWRRAQDSGRKTGKAASAKLTSREFRDAVRRGDQSALGKRDRGPVRLLARNYVDSRRMASSYLLLILPVTFVVPAIPALGKYGSLITIAALAGFAFEGNYAGRKVRALALQRGEEVRDSPFGLGFYMISRAYLPRRWRLPAPQVRRGDQI